MQGTRKTKNMYQHNIHIYEKRIIESKKESTKLRLKEQIRRIKKMIRRIEKRENLIKQISKCVLEYFGVEINMRALLMYKFPNLKSEYNKSLYLVRSMFFKACSMNGIDGLMLYNYYRIDTCTKQVFYTKKLNGVSYIEQSFKDNWIKFRNYLKQNQCSTTTPH